MTEANYFRAYCERGVIENAPAGTPIRFVCSTANIGRMDGMVIRSGAWQLDNYRRNPVVLWGHDYRGQRLPIGRAEARVEGDVLVSDITFDQEDAFAREIERKYRQGFLHAVSVGWDPLKIQPRTATTPPEVTLADLLDVSAVPVPGDPAAIIQREGRALKELTSELNALIDPPEKPTTEAEGSWTEAARRMVRVFLEPSEDEAARKAEWAAVSKAYRQLGKVAPEWISNVEVTALEENELRGLFLEDEATVCAELFAHKRAGAVLSQANWDDLKMAMEKAQEAISLVQGVLNRATKEKVEERSAPAPDVAEEEPVAEEIVSPAHVRALQDLHALFQTA